MPLKDPLVRILFPDFSNNKFQKPNSSCQTGGTEKRSHSLNELERRTVAYHESGHALVGW